MCIFIIGVISDCSNLLVVLLFNASQLNWVWGWFEAKLKAQLCLKTAFSALLHADCRLSHLSSSGWSSALEAANWKGPAARGFGISQEILDKVWSTAATVSLPALKAIFFPQVCHSLSVSCRMMDLRQPALLQNEVRSIVDMWKRKVDEIEILLATTEVRTGISESLEKLLFSFPFSISRLTSMNKSWVWRVALHSASCLFWIFLFIQPSLSHRNL